MKVLKFTLEGKTAFFKKPDVNTYLYFTYGNIHKIALLGIFGAILGYKGYNQMKKGDEFPEFYERLKDLKVGIVPNNKNGIIDKKVQIFNNSVGYASKEVGGNLIVKEQWLENPSWDIYLLLDGEESEKIEEAIKNSTFIYLPYLGKNDHLADISNIRVLDGEKALEINTIDSLMLREEFLLVDREFDILSDEEYIPTFKYEEKLPTELDKVTNAYITKAFMMTNSYLQYEELNNVYCINELNIQFI